MSADIKEPCSFQILISMTRVVCPEYAHFKRVSRKYLCFRILVCCCTLQITKRVARQHPGYDLKLSCSYKCFGSQMSNLKGLGIIPNTL